VFARFGPHEDGAYPNTLWYAERAVSLPIYPTITEDEQAFVARTLLDALSRLERK